MASSHGLKPQSDICNSTGMLAATIKHIAEDNPIKVAEATGRLLIEMIRCYITTPFPWITSSAFIIGDGMVQTMNALEMPGYLHHEASSTCSKTMSDDIIGLGLGRGM